jgi:hypothetical protein
MMEKPMANRMALRATGPMCGAAREPSENDIATISAKPTIARCPNSFSLPMA